MPGTALSPFAFERLLETHVDTADQELLPRRFKAGAGFDSDFALIEAIGQSLRATGYRSLRNLGIDIVGGQVVLTGRVPTYHQKQLAQSTVQHLKLARGITNDIEVSCCR